MADGLTWRSVAIEGPGMNPGPDGRAHSVTTGLTVLYHDSFLVHSPDGTRSVIVEGGNRLAWTNKHLAVLDATGGGSEITEAERVALAPAWSPDGSLLAYVEQPASVTPQGYESMAERRIWTMSPDGSGKARLTDSEVAEEYPQWSPDGAAILYVRPNHQPSGSRDPRRASVWLHRLSDGSETLILDGLEYSVDGSSDNILYMGYYAWDALFDWWRP